MGSQATWPRCCHQNQILVTSDDLAVPSDDVLAGGELLEGHGASCVELLGGDADLGAEAEALAVDPAGGGVYQHGGGIDLAGEAVGRLEVVGDDGLGVARRVALHPV